jgi:hypothetical protein
MHCSGQSGADVRAAGGRPRDCDSHDRRLGGHRADHPLLLLDLAARAAATLGADAPGAVRLEGDPSVSLTANARLRMAASGAIEPWRAGVRNAY